MAVGQDYREPPAVLQQVKAPFDEENFRHLSRTLHARWSQLAIRLLPLTRQQIILQYALIRDAALRAERRVGEDDVETFAAINDPGLHAGCFVQSGPA